MQNVFSSKIRDLFVMLTCWGCYCLLCLGPLLFVFAAMNMDFDEVRYQWFVRLAMTVSIAGCILWNRKTLHNFVQMAFLTVLIYWIFVGYVVLFCWRVL